MWCFLYHSHLWEENNGHGIAVFPTRKVCLRTEVTNWRISYQTGGTKKTVITHKNKLSQLYSSKTLTNDEPQKKNHPRQHLDVYHFMFQWDQVPWSPGLTSRRDFEAIQHLLDLGVLQKNQNFELQGLLKSDKNTCFQVKNISIDFHPTHLKKTFKYPGAHFFRLHHQCVMVNAWGLEIFNCKTWNQARYSDSLCQLVPITSNLSSEPSLVSSVPFFIASSCFTLLVWFSPSLANKYISSKFTKQVGKELPIKARKP